MIKVKFKDLNDNNFANTLFRISNDQGWGNFQAAYNASKIVRRVKKEIAAARDMHQKLLETYVEKDEKGGFLKAKEGGFPYVMKEGVQKEYEDKMAEFLETDVEIDCHPISQDDLGTVKLSPSDLVALSPILDLQA